MTAKRSAGLVAVRRRAGAVELLLAHPGGPFFRRKDEGAWTVPKGLVEGDEAPLATAQREWTEETGFALPPGPFVPLGHVIQRGGKRVDAWAVQADVDPAALVSNPFELEWPPRSGRRAEFPEIDRVEWFAPEIASQKILAAQRPLLERALQPEALEALGLA